MSDRLAQAAVEPVRGGMVVGLGTGRAASRGVRALAARVKDEGLEIVCVCTSDATAALAKELGLATQPMARTTRVDYLFDGVDAYNDRLQMIKGGGGAMTREKILARLSEHNRYLAQTEKHTDELGTTHPLPIEVIPEARASIEAMLRDVAQRIDQRMGGDGRPVLTDNGHPILDALLKPGVDLIALDSLLDAKPGVVGQGLFLDDAAEIVVEDGAGEIAMLGG